jgi:hypothetical protein
MPRAMRRLQARARGRGTGCRVVHKRGARIWRCARARATRGWRGACRVALQAGARAPRVEREGHLEAREPTPILADAGRIWLRKQLLGINSRLLSIH